MDLKLIKKYIFFLYIFFIRSTLHPVFFFLFIMRFDRTPYVIKVGINTSKIDLSYYIPIVIGMYALYYVAFYKIWKIFFKKISFQDWSSKIFSWFELIPLILSGFNLYVWTVQGMEGNIMGFIFFPLMLLSTFIIFSLFCSKNIAVFYDLKENK